AVLITMLSLAVLINFFPGRVDHHNWQLLTAGLSLGLLLRMILVPGHRGIAVLAGVIHTVGLWVGAEILPWIAAFNAMLCLHWILRGDRTGQAAFQYAAAFAVAAVVLLPVAHPSGNLFSVACDAFSIAFVGGAVSVFLFWGIIRFLKDHAASYGARLAGTLVAAIAAAAFLFILFPDCRAGPYGQVDHLLNDLWIAKVGATRSVAFLFRSDPWLTPVWVLGPLAATCATVWALARSRGRRFSLWLAISGFVLLSMVMGFSRIRMLAFAQLFAIVPLAWLLGLPWHFVGEHWLGWRRGVARFALLLLFGPLFWFAGVLMSFQDKAQEHQGAHGAPIARGCDIQAVSSTLNARPGLGDQPKVIAGFIDFGAKLLFYTPHAVLAGQYHRNNEGNLAVVHLFTAEDEDTARDIVTRRKVDLVLICTAAPEMKLYKGKTARPSFVDRLGDGDLPPWLRSLPVPAGTTFKLFQVVPVWS
ncbi:MAG: hypothetical protein OEY85_07225, partial [Rhodospirillales bacterium]|nr:hypothetical protein [Rhodospirillales bacterium]